MESGEIQVSHARIDWNDDGYRVHCTILPAVGRTSIVPHTHVSQDLFPSLYAMQRDVCLFIFPRFELLDLSGPLSAFRAQNGTQESSRGSGTAQHRPVRQVARRQFCLLRHRRQPAVSGAHAQRPDYAFADGVLLRIYQFAAGSSARVEVPSLSCGADVEFSVRRDEGVVRVVRRGRALATGYDAEELYCAAVRRNVAFVPGPDEGRVTMRLNFTMNEPNTMRSAIATRGDVIWEPAIRCARRAAE